MLVFHHVEVDFLAWIPLGVQNGLKLNFGHKAL